MILLLFGQNESSVINDILQNIKDAISLLNAEVFCNHKNTLDDDVKKKLNIETVATQLSKSITSFLKS